MSFFNTPDGKNPTDPLPSHVFKNKHFKNGEIVWFGHSTVLFKTAGITVLTDPVFYNASPVPEMIAPFEIENEPQINDLPSIDVVLISHDHYDHLDYKAVIEMDNKVKKYMVPLGIKAHLQRWGVADEKIEELEKDLSRTKEEKFLSIISFFDSNFLKTKSIGDSMSNHDRDKGVWETKLAYYVEQVQKLKQDSEDAEKMFKVALEKLKNKRKRS